MGYRGHVRNGVVEFEEPIPLAEGTEVEVLPRGDGSGETRDEPIPEADKDVPTLRERFGDLIGIGNGLPEDMAKNHDHYIHGTPKL